MGFFQIDGRIHLYRYWIPQRLRRIRIIRSSNMSRAYDPRPVLATFTSLFPVAKLSSQHSSPIFNAAVFYETQSRLSLSCLFFITHADLIQHIIQLSVYARSGLRSFFLRLVFYFCTANIAVIFQGSNSGLLYELSCSVCLLSVEPVGKPKSSYL